MKSNTRIMKFVALAALVAGSVPTVSAAGLLGQRYVSGTLDWTLYDEPELDTGRGLSLALNQPLSQSFDLSLSYTFLDTGIDEDLGEGEIFEADASAHTLLFGGTFYGQAANVKPFIRLEAGWLGTQVGGDDENDVVYVVTPGVEIPAGEKASLSLYVSWMNTFDDDLEDDGIWFFGAITEFQVASNWSVLGKAVMDEDSNWQLSAGALLRF